MAIRVGYYPGIPAYSGMNDDPVVSCTSGCTIPVNHYNLDAWYQILYLDSNNLVRSVSDAQKIAKSD